MLKFGRDPFARLEVVKRPMYGTCKWCGQQNRRNKVWKYVIEHDGGRKEFVPGVFCSIGCLNAYHR